MVTFGLSCPLSPFVCSFVTFVHEGIDRRHKHRKKSISKTVANAGDMIRPEDALADPGLGIPRVETPPPADAERIHWRPTVMVTVNSLIGPEKHSTRRPKYSVVLGLNGNGRPMTLDTKPRQAKRNEHN